jgi:hypothetical protein
MKNNKGFKGCYYKDELPKTLKNGESIVINLDSSSTGNGGTHWTALKKTKDGYVYFDSFGMPCPEQVKQLTKEAKILWNSSQFQHKDSVLCGYYCVYVLRKLYDGQRFYDILYSLNLNSTQANEELIRSLF